MELIAHRINTIEELKRLPVNYGVEIDLRDSGESLILQHDPFTSGESFEDYLKYYHHGTMILNIKSERIEYKVLNLLQKYNIDNYFFLDSSFPMIYQLSEEGEKNIAVRYSEFESIDTVLSMKGRINWVWIDCFNDLPLNLNSYHSLKQGGFNLCLVSPELQGREQEIESYKQYLMENSIEIDAVCTKIRELN